jgi:type IV secretory pathway protease TraF
MKEQKIRFTPIPSTAEVEAERERLAYRSRYMRVLRSTVYTLLVVAAVAVLLATLFLPVLQVSGDSMNPTLHVDELALGECDIKFPYQVPENRYFVLGDHRATSIDSRSSVIGCVEKSQIVGKVFLRVWPLSNFSLIH